MDKTNKLTVSPDVKGRHDGLMARDRSIEIVQKRHKSNSNTGTFNLLNMMSENVLFPFLAGTSLLNKA